MQVGTLTTWHGGINVTGDSDDNRALMHNPSPTPEIIGIGETRFPSHANETHPAFLPVGLNMLCNDINVIKKDH